MWTAIASGGDGHAAAGVERIGARAEGGEQDVGASQGDVLHHHDLVQHGQPAVCGSREIRNVDRRAVEDDAGEHAEEGEQPAGDLGLEADEHEETGDQFEQAGKVGERGGRGQAGAGDHAGGAGRIDQLAEAGIDEDEGEKDAGDKDDGVVAAGHARLLGAARLWPALARLNFLERLSHLFAIGDR